MHAFTDPITKQYADFEGRTNRRAFWTFVLLYIISAAIVKLITDVLGIDFVYDIYVLALLVPNIAITTRRLHDTGRSGWWQLLWLVPIVGWIILIVFLVGKSKSLMTTQAIPSSTEPQAPSPKVDQMAPRVE